MMMFLFYEFRYHRVAHPLLLRLKCAGGVADWIIFRDQVAKSHRVMHIWDLIL